MGEGWRPARTPRPRADAVRPPRQRRVGPTIPKHCHRQRATPGMGSTRSGARSHPKHAGRAPPASLAKPWPGPRRI